MSASRTNVFGVLRIPDVRRMWTAGVISDIGNFITFVALAIRVHDLTGRSVAVGLVFALRSIPWFTLGPIAGVLVDRADRRLVMVGADLARAILVVLLALTTQIWQLYLIAFLSGLFGPLFRPARQAVLPEVVTGDDYVSALAVNEIAHQTLHTIGPAFGGAAVLLVGARNAFLIDGATFVLSASVLFRLSVRGRKPGRPATFAVVLADLRDGARHLWRDKILRPLIASRAATIVGDAGIAALLVAYVRDSLHRGSGSYGLALAVGGIGTAVLSFLLARLGTGLRRAPLLLLAAASPLLFIPLALQPSFPVLLGLMAIEGMAITGLALYDDVIIASRTPEHLRGRIFSLSGGTAELAGFTGSIGYGALGDSMSAGGAMGVAGVVSSLLGAVALLPGLPGLRADDRARRKQDTLETG